MTVDSGFLPIAVDCFADQDTRMLAFESVKVNSLHADDLLPALRDIAQRYAVRRLVYGSGFEQYPDSLAMLEHDWLLLANSADLFKQQLNKREFFARLDQLGIQHPNSCFTKPVTNENWLFKPYQGQGGAGIVAAGLTVASEKSGYWQQRLDGEAYSALFIADGHGFKILGFNRQWTLALHERAPLMFAGIHNHARLASGLRRKVRSWLARLLQAYPFRGLCSLDFMVSDGQCYLLEINSRIPASAQLYRGALLARHLQVCQGGAILRRKIRSRPRGYNVLYADRQIRLPLTINWPSWVVDLPASGVIIDQGQPICSIIAGGKNAAQVRNRLRQQQQIIEHLLNIRIINSHAIPSKRQ